MHPLSETSAFRCQTFSKFSLAHWLTDSLSLMIFSQALAFLLALWYSMIFCPTLALHSIIYPCSGLGWLAWLRYHMFSLIDRDTHNKEETLHWWSLIRKLCSNGWWWSENDQQCVMMNEPWLNNWVRMGRQPEKRKCFIHWELKNYLYIKSRKGEAEKEKRHCFLNIQDEADSGEIHLVRQH